jgi:hypothetical protein
MCDENKEQTIGVVVKEESNSTDNLRKKFFKTALEKYGVSEEVVKTEYRSIGSDGGQTVDDNEVEPHCLCRYNQLQTYLREYKESKEENVKLPCKMDHCLCGASIIENCYLVHKTTTYPILVSGNCCIKKFIHADNRKRHCKLCDAPHLNRLDNVCTTCRQLCLVCGQRASYKKNVVTLCSQHKPRSYDGAYYINTWHKVPYLVIDQPSYNTYELFLGESSVVFSKVQAILKKTKQVCNFAKLGVIMCVIRFNCRKSLVQGVFYQFKSLQLSLIRRNEDSAYEALWECMDQDVNVCTITFVPDAFFVARQTKVLAAMGQKEVEEAAARQCVAINKRLIFARLIVYCQEHSFTLNRSLSVYHLMTMIRIRFRLGFQSAISLFLQEEQRVELLPETTLVSAFTQHHKNGYLYVNFVNEKVQEGAETQQTQCVFQNLKPFEEVSTEKAVKPECDWDLLFDCKFYKTYLQNIHAGSSFKIDLKEQEVIFLAKVLYERNIYYGETLISYMVLTNNTLQAPCRLEVQNDRFDCESYWAHMFHKVQVYCRKTKACGTDTRTDTRTDTTYDEQRILLVSTGYITRLGSNYKRSEDETVSKRSRLY